MQRAFICPALDKHTNTLNFTLTPIVFMNVSLMPAYICAGPYVKNKNARH